MSDEVPNGKRYSVVYGFITVYTEARVVSGHSKEIKIVIYLSIEPLQERKEIVLIDDPQPQITRPKT